MQALGSDEEGTLGSCQGLPEPPWGCVSVSGSGSYVRQGTVSEVGKPFIASVLLSVIRVALTEHCKPHPGEPAFCVLPQVRLYHPLCSPSPRQCLLLGFYHPKVPSSLLLLFPSPLFKPGDPPHLSLQSFPHLIRSLHSQHWADEALSKPAGRS